LSSTPSIVLLDTNILIHLIRGSQVGTTVNETLGLSQRPERPLISVITVGEIQAFALKLGWGATKRAALETLIRQLVIVQLPQGDIVSRYADIDKYSERDLRPPRSMGQNDLWIAATASATRATLITTDSDFDHLSPRFLSVIRIDPRTGDIIAR
jgi:tRNA(fMet)-specific endonuclease VapC